MRWPACCAPEAAPSIGWTAASAGGRPKISQPCPTSTYLKPSVSRRNARSASGLEENSRTWMPLTSAMAHTLPQCGMLEFWVRALRVPIVQRPRTWPFQGQNTGSNPVGDAKRSDTFRHNSFENQPHCPFALELVELPLTLALRGEDQPPFQELGNNSAGLDVVR